ncbi:MAG TPA: hypothetical protein VGM53_00230 [Streptosporangiaceae bacterium]
MLRGELTVLATRPVNTPGAFALLESALAILRGQVLDILIAGFATS